MEYSDIFIHDEVLLHFAVIDPFTVDGIAYYPATQSAFKGPIFTFKPLNGQTKSYRYQVSPICESCWLITGRLNPLNNGICQHQHREVVN